MRRVWHSGDRELQLAQSDSAAAPANIARDARPAVVMLVSSLGMGGAERQTVALAGLLSDRFHVVVAYLKSDQTCGTLAVKDSVETCSLEASSRFDMRAARRLAALTVEHDAQLILCANPYCLMYAQIARVLSRRKFAVLEVLHATKPATLKEQVDMIVYRPFLWAADHLVYLCERQREYWTRRGVWAKRVHVIYNGVDCDFFDPDRFAEGIDDRRKAYGFDPRDRIVGICALLRPEKAHEDLLQAVAILRAQGDDWKILIIGDGPMRPAIERSIVKLGLQGSVAITGLQADVRDFISICDILALVSTTETFSMSALEAMAMEKPMVMSDVGGAREQITHGHNGLLFPAGDVRALAECLRTYSDRQKMRQMGAFARARVLREFSQQAMANRYTELVTQAISNAARSNDLSA